MGVDRDHAPPHFFIVGAPKCGTTSMAQYLGQHPEVFVVRGEPHFFGSDIAYNSPRLTRSQYLKICRASAGKPVVGDRSTWYLFSRRAATEIHAFNPEARIVAMLRNPVDMVHSLHRHHFQRGRRDDLERLEDALAAEPERRRGRRVPRNARFKASLFYSDIPRYSEQLQRYFARFGRERVKVILFDDLKRDPAATYVDTLRFLGVDPSFEADFAVHNVAGPAPDTLLYRTWKASTLRYRIRSAIPSRLYGAIRERRRKRLEQRAGRQPPGRLDSGLRQSLQRQFADEIDRLEALLQRDLSTWRTTDPLPA
jgi:hypothetical protein